HWPKLATLRRHRRDHRCRARLFTRIRPAKINPTLYLVEPKSFSLMSLRLAGGDIPETLERIDRLWARTGASHPIKRYFLSDYIQSLYVAVLREAEMFGVFACIAVLLAGLGLFALTASITERRTREIGIRKAMGAD